MVTVHRDCSNFRSSGRARKCPNIGLLARFDELSPWWVLIPHMACCGGSTSTAVKREHLESQSPLGVYLSSDELDKLATACTISPIKSNQPLRDSPFYIVLEGQVVVKTQAGKILVSKVAGNFFTRCGL